jgi:putative transposase
MLMQTIDQLYTARPYLGVPRMVLALEDLGHRYNHKRIARLMRVMGLMAVLPGPHTSRRHPAHAVYPYLLRGRVIARPDEVWCADITYIPMSPGFLYLVAIMDWYSRYVLAWEISNMLETAFCVAALEEALRLGSPEIFNTDQGVQFTSADWVDRLTTASVRISMDGRGRALDNVFVERLWRTIKYEDIYIRDYRTGTDLREGLATYIGYYNTARRHQSLGYRTPEEVYMARPLP